MIGSLDAYLYGFALTKMNLPFGPQDIVAVAEAEGGYPNFQKMRDEAADQQIESVGKELRSMMPWIDQEF